ncbi:MAG: M56 family metallopeptidase [Vicinamibacterales bacterium]
MILSRAVLLVTAIVASYVALSALASTIVALLWKAGWLNWTKLPARARAGRLATLRLLPATVMALVTITFVFPLFLAMEPRHEFEEVGPALLIVGLVGVGLVVRAVVTAARTVAATRRIRRRFLQNATPLTLTGVSGITSYTIESTQPIVALVGIWRPAFVAARIVVEACTESELANMVRHERTHFIARDNLKRLLMACVPDLLAFTPYHRAIGTAWHDAAEDAADDAVTQSEPRARLELAQLLLKVANLAPSPSYVSATVSPFIDAHGLERRVRRLVTDQSEPLAKPSDHLAGAVLIGIALLVSTLLFSSNARSIVHSAVEAVVAAGAQGR